MITEQTRLKMRLAKLGKKHTPHSKETRLKMSLASKGKLKSEEHKRALSESKLLKYQTGVLISPFKFIWSKDPNFLRGENNPRWIKDRTKIKVSDRKFHDPNHKQWHMSVKNRDGWKCKISNGDCSGRLEAHHILGWKSHPDLRYQVNNGITLCYFHHPRKRKDEEKLSPYFQKLVASVD